MKKTMKEGSAGNGSQCNKLYLTSDERAFFEEQEAIIHADKLPDKTITHLTDEEADAEVQHMSDSNWHEQMEELLDEIEMELL